MHFLVTMKKLYFVMTQDNSILQSKYIIINFPSINMYLF